MVRRDPMERERLMGWEGEGSQESVGGLVRVGGGGRPWLAWNIHPSSIATGHRQAETRALRGGRREEGR